MIEKVSYANLKASKAVTLQLPGCSLLTGGNGTGKTTLLQAIKLGITNSLPEASVSGTADVFKLANSAPNTDFMEVGMTLTGGNSFTRSYERTNKYQPATDETKEKVTQEIDLSPEPPGCGTKLTDKEAVIRLWAGLEPVVVDVRSFLTLSGDKRRDFFYRLGEPSKVTAATMQKLLSAQARKEERLAGEVLLTMSTALVEEHGADLDAYLKWLATEKSLANKEIQNSRGAAIKMAEAQRERKTVAGDLLNLKSELKNARGDKELVASELAKNAPLVAALTSRQERIDSLSGRIVKLKTGGADIDSLKKTLAGWLKREPELKEENATALTKLRKDHQDTGGLWKTAREKAAADLRAVREFCVRRSAFEELEDIRNKLCKECGPLFPVMPDMDKQVMKKESNSKTAAEAEGAAYQKSLLSDKFLTEAINAGNQAEQNMRNSIDSLEREITAAELAFSTKGIELEEAENELKEVLAKRPENPVAVDGLEQQLAGLKTRIGTLEGQLEAKQEEEKELDLQLRSVGDADEAETRLYCIKKMVKVLGPSGLKGDLVKETLDPIKAEVNEGLKLFGIVGVEFTFLTLDGRGNEIFDFGWEKDGNYIAFDSLSTGQQCVLLACLVAVICKHSHSPLKLLALDNLEVISADFEEAFFRGLPKVAEYCGLDNVIVASSKLLPASIIGDVEKGSRIPAEVCKTAIEGMVIIEFPLVG